MDVLRSLITRHYLVRVPDGRHGAVAEFDARLNEVTVQFGSSGPFAKYHFTKLRAGNEQTEEWVCGCVTRRFPKSL